MIRFVCAAVAVAGAAVPVFAAGSACTWVTGNEEHQPPDVKRPAYLVPYVDDMSGLTVTRVGGDLGTAIPNVGGTWQDEPRHHYQNTSRTWNADGSWLYLQWRSNLMLDGRTYQPLFKPQNMPANFWWHPTNPKLALAQSGNSLVRYYPETGTSETIRTFSDYALGSDQIRFSDDGRYVGLAGTKNGTNYMFVYDIETDTKYPDIDITGRAFSACLSATGKYIVSPYGKTEIIYDRDGTEVGTYDCMKHNDFTVDANGDDVMVGVRNCDPNSQDVVAVRLRDQHETFLTDGGVPNHVSARNFQKPGWVAASYDRQWAAGAEPYRGEVVLAKLDGSKSIRRIVHTHSYRTEYRAETHPNLSPDGTRVIFASSWDAQDGLIHSYVVELCKEDVTGAGDIAGRVDAARSARSLLRDQKVEIFAPNGKMIHQGSLSLRATGEVPAGVYIVRVPGQSQVRSVWCCGVRRLNQDSQD